VVVAGARGSDPATTASEGLPTRPTAATTSSVLRTTTSAEAITVTADLDNTVVERYLGLGVQWNPFAYEPSAEDYRTILRRIDFLRPAIFRVTWGSQAYCLGFSPDGQPRYSWKEGDQKQRKRLERLTFILDYAKRRNIDVMLGEWVVPKALFADQTDPRWSRIVADFLRYLRDERGYANIRYYHHVNEPNGSWSGIKDYDTWVASIRNLKKEFDRRGLSKDVTIVGPDATGSSTWTGAFRWLKRMVKDVPEAVGVYDLHWYASDQEVLAGVIERTLTEQLRKVRGADKSSASKPAILGEAGIITGWRKGIDQQTRIRDYDYGLLMADYVAQAASAGWGAIAWYLDDAMHVANSKHAPAVPDKDTLKEWGFWNSQGARMGNPDDFKPRPWFYTWSLMSRLLPKDCRIVKVDLPPTPRLRTVAGVRSDKGKQNLSVILVNSGDVVRTVKLRAPLIGSRASLTLYQYSKEDRPTDAEGLAAAKETLSDADLREGLEITLPPHSAIFLDAGATLK